MIGRESVEGAGETRQPSSIGQERVVFIGSFRLVYVSLCPRLVTQRQVALFAALGGAIKSGKLPETVEVSESGILSFRFNPRKSDDRIGSDWIGERRHCSHLHCHVTDSLAH